MSPNDLTVVVVTHKSASLLEDFFNSLAAAGIGESQIVVVDSASGDDTVSTARKFAPEALVVELEENLGFAAGNNAGMVARPAPIYAFLNPDVRVKSDALAAMCAVVTETDALVVPKLLEDDGSIAFSLRRDPSLGRLWASVLLGGHRADRIFGASELITNETTYLESCYVDWATGAAIVASAEMFQKVGPWDESFWLFSEETELMMRARKNHFAVRYIPDAIVHHVGSRSHMRPDLRARLVSNQLELYRRNHSMVPTALFRAGLFLNELTRSLRPGGAGAAHRAALRQLL